MNKRLKIISKLAFVGLLISIHASSFGMEAGANMNAVDAYGRTALHLAIYRGLTEIANQLIQANADVQEADVVGDTPLHFAAMHGYTELVTPLLQAGANREAATKSGSTPLFEAVTCGRTEVANQLLQAGVNVHAVMRLAYHESLTPLHMAIAHCEEIVDQLLLAGASVHAVDSLGRTMFHIGLEWWYNQSFSVPRANEQLSMVDQVLETFLNAESQNQG